MSEHYSNGRKYSYLSRGWIFEDSWNDREEVAKLQHELRVSKRDYSAIYALYSGLEEDIQQLEQQNKEMLEMLRAALEWIDAVPSETQLPAMPGFDRDWVDEAIAKIESQKEGG